MIAYDEALAILNGHVSRLDAVRRPVERAWGAVLAQDIVSASGLPPFDNAAMDGFALRYADLTGGGDRDFAVTGTQPAGAGQVQAHTGVWEITTGARLPDEFDTVVPIEHIEILQRDGAGQPLRIRLPDTVQVGQHVRRCGADVTPGMMLMHAGERLQSSHLMMLAALGIETVEVVRQPRLALLITGSELADGRAEMLASGQIRDSNGPFLHARAREAGAEIVYRQTVGDAADVFLDMLQMARAADPDLIVSTGAVSMGRFDFVPAALRRAGAELLFHKVKIRPGKPILLARLPGGTPYLGLPGNPVSAAVGMRFFVEPALRRMLGMPAERPLSVPLTQACTKRMGLRTHLRARLTADAHGALHVDVLPGQESFRIASMLSANVWAVAGAESETLEAGARIDVYSLGHFSPPVVES